MAEVGNGRSRWQTPALAGLLLAATLVYLNSLSGEFVWDDRKLIVEDRAIKSWNHLDEIFSHDFFERNEHDLAYGYYRPLTTLSYLLDCTVWALRPFGYHLTNVLLHAGCTLLVALSLLHLGWGLPASVLSGVLFAVHPLHTENVAWIAGRGDLLAFFFCIGALVAFLAAGREPVWMDHARPETRAGAGSSLRSRRQRGLSTLAVVGFAMGLLAKEMSVVLIGWLALTNLVAYRRGLHATWLALRPYLAVLAAYCVWRFLVIDVPAPRVPPEHNLSAVVLSVCPTIVRYLSWLLLPLSLNGYVQNPYVTSLFEARLLVSVIILAILGVLVHRHARHSAKVQLAVGMLLVSFVPILNFVRVAGPADMGNVMAERFCYFPSFPFLALVGLAISNALGRESTTPWLRRCLIGAVAAVIGMGAYGTLARNRDWRTELTFLTTTLKQSPTAVLLWGNLANYHLERRELDEAARAIERASALDPDNYSVLSSRALWYVLKGRATDAIPLQARIADASRSGKTPALNNLAYLYRATGAEDEAVAILEELIRQGNGYADVHFNLAEIYRSRGQIDRARSEYQIAIEDRPNSLPIANALSTLEMDTGRLAEAETIYGRMLRMYPGDARILNNVALIRHRRGDVRGAVTLLARAVEIQPEYVNARLNYAQLLASSGRTVEAAAQLEQALRFASGTEIEQVVAEQLATLRLEPAVAPAAPATTGPARP